MADKKITELPAATALDTDDLFAVVEDGTTVKATVAQVATAAAADATLLEAVSDQVGTMVTGNTETGIAVTYQDSDNTLDFVVDDTTKVANSLIAAKGDLIGATANDTPAVVTVGADRTLLRSDSNASTGVRWGTDLIRTRSTYWHVNAMLDTVTGTAWPIINRAYWVPFFLPGRNVITAVGINVSAAGTASNVVRLGIFTDNSGVPGNVVDQGTVAGDAIAFCTWTPSSPVAVTDVFWLVAAPQGASSPGSTWLAKINTWGLAMGTAQENGAAYAGTYTTGLARYSAESGAFTNNPTLSYENGSRNPYLAVRLQ